MLKMINEKEYRLLNKLIKFLLKLDVQPSNSPASSSESIAMEKIQLTRSLDSPKLQQQMATITSSSRLKVD